MPLPDLSPAELLRCVRACAALRLPPQVGSYFREFLARRVQAAWPDLAHKVRSMSDRELNCLYAYILPCQAGRHE